MNTFASYLVTANLLMALGYAFYYWLYRKEENFQFNRVFLLGTALFSWLIPLFPWANLVETSAELGLATPQLVETWTFNLGEELSNTFPAATTNESAALSPRDWLSSSLAVLSMIYLAVTATLLIRFLVSLGSLFRLVRRFPREQKEDHLLLHADEEISPFSFFNMIILNPKLYQPEQYELIYQHELVHARQWHNLDILIAELWCILCWFNPLVWKMKNQIRQNLEFIADAAVLKIGVNRKVYQYCLLKLDIGNEQHLQLANHFNQSILKKRILMMNRKKSPNTFSLKHLLLLPLLAVMILISWPLQSQPQQLNNTEHGATSMTDYPANSTTEHTATSITDHPGTMDEFANAPIMDGESVYGIVRADMTMETLEIMKQEFANRGVEITASNINFTEKGKLSSIRLEMVQWNKASVTKELNNKLGAVEGLIYVSFQHNKVDKSVNISIDTDLPRNNVSDAHKQLLKQFTGIAVISKTGDIYMKGYLDLDDDGADLFKSLKKRRNNKD